MDGKLTRKQRVEIAKDVIALLRSRQRKIKIMTGTYFSPASYDKMEDVYEKGGQLTSKKLPKCEVCARGALFLASVDRYNKCSLADIHDVVDEVQDRSAEEWGDQVIDIEDDFEIGGHPLPLDPKKRLLAIMENIVANGGEYKSPVDRDYDVEVV